LRSCGDINSQILNFGLPSPLDIQISGPNVDANHKYANALLQKVRAIPGAVDVRIQQPSTTRSSTWTSTAAKRGSWSDSERRGVEPAGVAVGQLSDVASFWMDPTRVRSTALPRRHLSIA